MDGTRVAATLSRRDFIFAAVSAAGGLLVGIGAAPSSAHATAISEQPWNDNDYAPHEIDVWIAIDPDDSILIRYQRSEMRQGSMTALPMMITEELQCDWSKVRVEYASSNRSVREHRVYGNMYSHGSMSVRESQKMHPSFAPRTVTSPVETTQVAPTILKALGLDPRALDGVRLEGTQVLPAVQFED